MRRRHWVLVAALLAGGCSSSDDGGGTVPSGGSGGVSGGGSGGSAAAAGTGGGAGTAGQAGMGGGSGGATGGQAGSAGFGAAAGQAGAAGSGGGSTGGSGGGSDKLFPLESGASWTYQVTAVGAGSVCSPGTHKSEVLGPTSVGGKDGFDVTSWCSAVSGSDVLAPGNGDEVFLYYEGQWLTVVDGNVAEGHTWPYFNSSYTWRKEGTVTVPAGTYDDCWSAVQNVSYTAYTTYCRGVGPVRSYSADLSGAGWDAKLSSTTW